MTSPLAPLLPATVDHSLAGRRVAMVLFSFYPSDPRPRRVVETMIRAGMEVDLICLSEEAPDHGAPGLRCTRLPIRHERGGKLSYAVNYFTFMAGAALLFGFRCLFRRYDLVYVHNMPDLLVVSALLPKLRGAKVILDLHDPMPELMMTIYGLGRDSLAVRCLTWFEKWSIARVELAITVNEACRELFAARSCPPQKIAVVMNSPDEAIFPLRPVSGCTRGAVSRWPFVIMYHGSLVERNGLDLAIEALDLVREQIEPVELRIYGKRTPFLDRVLADAARRGLEGCVHYLGPRRLEDLAGEIARCDLGVIPNHRSAFAEINTPTRIFEYLALGKPVIAPRTKGILGYFDASSLLLFEAGDAASLAHAIRRAATQPEQVRCLVDRGQKVYRSHQWTEERNTLLHLLSTLLNGGGTR